jgi:hypothetical protein
LQGHILRTGEVPLTVSFHLVHPHIIFWNTR